jgi:predicted transcriptional regulator
MDKNDLIWNIVELLMPVLTALIGAAFYFLTVWLKNKAAAIKNEDARLFVMDVITRSTDAVRDAVLATKQQLVDDLKAAHEDGALTEEEKLLAFTTAKNTFLNMVGEYGLNELKTVIGNVDTWLETMIEAWVSRLGEN